MSQKAITPQHFLTIKTPIYHKWWRYEMQDVSFDYNRCIVRLGGSLYRLDSQTFEPVWHMQMPHNNDSNHTNTPLFAQTERLIFSKAVFNKERDEACICAIDAESGALAWSVRVPASTSTPHFDNGRLRYLQWDKDWHKQMVFLEPQTGREVQRVKLSAEHKRYTFHRAGQTQFTCEKKTTSNMYVLDWNTYPQLSEPILESQSIKHVLAAANRLYVLGYSRERKTNILSVIDGQTDEPIFQTDIPNDAPWLQGGSFTLPYVQALGGSEYVILTIRAKDDRKTVCFDVASGQANWWHTHNGFRSYTYTQRRLFLRDDQYEGKLAEVDIATGSISSYELPQPIKRRLISFGDFVRHGDSRRGYHVYHFDQSIERPVVEIDLDTVEQTYPIRNLKELVITELHPMELKEKRYYEAVEIAKQTGDFEQLYTVMCDVFELEFVHPATKEYIESTIHTEKIAGPMNLKGFATQYKNIASYHHYFDDETSPVDKYMPGLPIGSMTYGEEFYLFFESGRMIGAHHDSQWSEYFYDLWERCDRDVIGALQDYVNDYGVVTYSQFAEFIRICREEHGVTEQDEFEARMTFENYIAAVEKSCGSPYVDVEGDMIFSTTFDGFSSYFYD